MFVETGARRMNNPEDRLIKLASTLFGKVLHGYLKLPGKYRGGCPNEYPFNEEDARTDVCYVVILRNVPQYINIEDESSRVNKNTLSKIIKYSTNIECIKRTNVISVITTTEPLDKCLKELNISETKILKPIIISFPEFDGDEKLKAIRKRIDNDELFSEEEAIEIIFLLRMFKKNQPEILEEVCKLFTRLKVEDPDFKERMKFCMQCIIHKYAKTVEDIEQLEKVIKLTITYEDYIEKQREEGIKEGIEKGIERGVKEGIERGKLQLAQIIAKTDGIQKAIELSGFTKEEIETGKLQPSK